MLKSPALWCAAVWVAVLIHVDWHLGRPGHDHRSFDLAYHWLLALPAFAPLPWVLLRRWPADLLRASASLFLLGSLLGQGVEPLGEILLDDDGWEPFLDSVRWRVFAEFLVAGALGYAASAGFAIRRARVNITRHSSR